MKPVPILAAGWVLCLSALMGARQDRGQDPPVFRAGVELIQIDASVLDGARRPVRDLTPADFNVFIDDEPRPIVAFKAVDVPPPSPPPSAAWMREIAPDVVTNARSTGHVVAIVIDDGSFNNTGAAELFTIRKTREVAKRAVDELGPYDLAAVVFTEHGRSAQNFTADRHLLLRAIDDAALFPSPAISLGERASCFCGACSIRTITRVAEVLQSLPQERKTILYLSAGLPIEASIQLPRNPIGASAVYNAEHCNSTKQRDMAEAIRRANQANVTVQAVDVRGLLAAGLDLQIAYLRAMSEDTGGRAVVRTNDMEAHIPALFAESRSYYLLGVEAPAGADDRQPRSIRVDVNRAGVEVRTRRTYQAPTAEQRERLRALQNRDADAAMASVLPKADLPLDVAVFPLADPNDRERVALGIVVGITPRTRPDRTGPENVYLIATAFHPETGTSVATQRQPLSIDLNAIADESGRHELLSQLSVPPGRYEIRVGVEMGDGETGSVYTYADAPDFQDEELSLSGPVLSAPVPRLRTPPTAFGELVPVFPTARRSFRQTDRVTAWLRAHGPAGVRGAVTMRITDSRDQVAADRTDPIVFATGPEPVGMDHRVDLPVESLAAGEYLLTIEVSAADKRVRRAVRFRIK